MSRFLNGERYVHFEFQYDYGRLAELGKLKACKTTFLNCIASRIFASDIKRFVFTFDREDKIKGFSVGRMGV